MSAEKMISPIHPVRQFQLDPDFRRKCDYVREKEKQQLAPTRFQSGAEVAVAGFDFKCPVTPGMTANDLQAHLGKTMRAIDEMSQFVAFWDGPRQIFSFDSHLAGLLSETEVGDVPWEVVRLPYEAFYVHFGCALTESLDFNGRKYKADGAYVRLQKGPSVIEGFLSGALHVIVTTKLVEPKYEEACKANTVWRSLKEPVYTVTISGTDGETVGSALERGRKAELELAKHHDDNLLKNALQLAAEEGVSTFDARNIHAEEQRFLRGEKLTTEALPLLFNCIFYLTSVAGEVEPVFPPDSPKGLVEKLAKANTPNRRSILSDDLLRRGYTKIRFISDPVPRTEPVGASAGRSVRTHWRRGHWRRQPIGAGLARVALKWIRPCVVNADKGEPIVGRVYDVRKDEVGGTSS